MTGTGTAGTVEPRDAGEAAEALKNAAREGLAVVPRGGGTKLGWGNPVQRPHVVLSTARMHRVVEHAWADLTVTVEPGCTIRALQDTLRARGQRVAADPLWPDQATVGGVLSTNDTGALRLRFGGWRDLVIGTTLAFSDGTIARSGGKVVKNVAGYDLSKLATGAFGTLGVITEAIFRLHPLPRHARTLSVRVPHPAGAQRVIAAVQDSKLAHTALQVRADGSGPPVVDVLIEGTAAGVDAQIRDARALAGGIRWEDASPAVWEARQRLWDDEGAVVKVSTLSARLARTLESLVHTCTDWSAVFQATGLGWVRCGCELPRWSGLLRDIRAGVQADGGSAVVLRRRATHDDADVWGEAGNALPLMRAVKTQFDPTGTLNPGRFVGGI